MIFKLTGNSQASSGTRISARCPHCGHNGTFESIGTDILNNNKTFGIRRCPNENCFGHLFFISNNQTREIIFSYPSDTIPFNKENIPENVLNAFQEAIISHANNCFVASAIMIRKTLEELCIDRGATGKNLYNRLQDLGAKIVIPNTISGV